MMPIPGTIGIGVVVRFDLSTPFLFYVNAVDKSGVSSIPVLASPSSDSFSMPVIGDYIKYIDSPSRIKRYAGMLSEDSSSWSGRTYEGKKLYDPNANQSNLLDMDRGDSYVGRYGRIYFNGDVSAHSEYYRSKLFLRDQGYAELKAYDFKINTEDGGISVYTTASTPENESDGPNFGDSLVLKRLTPAGVATTFTLDSSGYAELSACGKSSIMANTLGDVLINCGSDGADSPSYKAFLRIVNEVSSDSSTTPSKASLYSGSLDISTDNTAALSMSDLNISCTNSGKLSFGSMSLNSKGEVGVTASKISLNGGEAVAYKAALESLYSIVSNLAALVLSHTHAVKTAGSATSQTGTAAATTATFSVKSIGVTGTTKTIAG